MAKVFSILALLLSLTLLTKAQQSLISLNPDLNNVIETRQWGDPTLHLNIKPLHTAQVFGLDSLLKKAPKKESENKKGLVVMATPVINATFTFAADSVKSYPDYTIGLTANGYYKNRIGAGFTWYTGNAAYLPFTDSVIKQQHMVAGTGMAYGTKLGYTASYSDFYLSVKTGKFFVLDVGKGKTFLGDGYRSLLLSDNASPYPYFKLHAKVWKFNYMQLYAYMQNYNFRGVRNPDKFVVAHYLSCNFNSKLNFSFFESVVFANRDTSGKTKRFDVNYLNPVVFFRPIEYSLGSADNSFIGLSGKWNFYRKHMLYGQVMIDELYFQYLKADSSWWANKQAFQFGYKGYDIAGVKGLSVQYEFNLVRPYTYSHSLPTQSYSHNNQSLAHPAGSNLWENLFFVRYNKNRLMVEARYSFFNYGEDWAGRNYGKNIMLSYITRPADFGVYTGQGDLTKVGYFQLRGTWYLIPKDGLAAEAGVIVRNQSTSLQKAAFSGFYIGIKSRLVNSYRDF